MAFYSKFVRNAHDADGRMHAILLRSACSRDLFKRGREGLHEPGDVAMNRIDVVLVRHRGTAIDDQHVKQSGGGENADMVFVVARLRAGAEILDCHCRLW